MEFKVGDIVRRTNGYNAGMDVGMKGTISNISSCRTTLCFKEFNGGHMLGRFELVSSSSNLKKTMQKTIYKVLIVDKKTGKTTKEENVVAENEQQAILKVFKVDSDNAHIKVTKIDSFEVEEPVTAIMIKEDK